MALKANDFTNYEKREWQNQREREKYLEWKMEKLKRQFARTRKINRNWEDNKKEKREKKTSNVLGQMIIKNAYSSGRRKQRQNAKRQDGV